MAGPAESLIEKEPCAVPEVVCASPEVRAADEIYGIEDFNRRVWELIDNYQKPEYHGTPKSRHDSSRTALFEGLTAAGHLSVVELTGEQEEVNRAVINRLLNSLMQPVPAWEFWRRFVELRGELITQAVEADVEAGRLPEDTMVLDISDIPEAVTSGEIGRGIGYRWLNKKGMVRGTHFPRDSRGKRFRLIEQLSRSNSDDQSTREFMSVHARREIGMSDFGAAAEALGMHLITTRRVFPDGVVDVQRQLDGFAGPFALYGEDRRAPAAKNLPDYTELRTESARREAVLAQYYPKLADYEAQLNLKLHAGQITYDEKLYDYNQKLDDIINEICLLDPSYARDARGELSAKYFEKAAVLRAQGNHEAARQTLKQAIFAIDPNAAIVCGGGGSKKKDGSLEDKLNKKIDELYENANESAENWEWKEGVCVVKVCPTRPGKTKVGPCSICERCQAIFDEGGDPTKGAAPAETEPATVSSLLDKIIEKALAAKKDASAQAA